MENSIEGQLDKVYRIVNSNTNTMEEANQYYIIFDTVKKCINGEIIGDEDVSMVRYCSARNSMSKESFIKEQTIRNMKKGGNDHRVGRS